MSACAACTARLEHLRVSAASLALQLDPKRAPAPVTRLKAARTVAGLVAALAAGVLALAWWQEARVRPMESDGRLKGQGFAVTLVVKRQSGEVEHAEPGVRVSPQDAVRFVLSSRRAGYYAVLGVDAAGKVSRYYPDPEAGGAALAVLGEGRGQLLAGSVILDDTLGPEVFIAVLCERDLGVKALEEAAAAAHVAAKGDVRSLPPLQAGCLEDHFLVEKVK